MRQQTYPRNAPRTSSADPLVAMTKHMKTFYIIIILTFSFFTNAQKIDSLKSQIVWEFEIVDSSKSELVQIYSEINDGVYFFSKGDKIKALEIFNAVISKGYEVSKAYSNRGSVYFEMKKLELALNDYNKAIFLDSLRADYWYNRGLLYQEMEKIDLAINDYSKALQINQYHFHSAFKLGNYYAFVSINDAKAFNVLNNYLEKPESNKNDADIYFIRGVIQNRNNKYLESISDFKKSISLDSSQSDYFYNRGLAYYNLKNYDSAIKDYSKAILLNPKDGRINYNRALCYEAQRKFEKAILDYNVDLKLNGETARAFNNRGRCYMILNDFNNAYSDYQKALELEPKRPLTLHNMGLLYLRNDNPKKGCPYLKEAKDLGYPDTKIYDQYCK